MQETALSGRDDSRLLEKVIRFENARIELSKWSEHPHLDALVSYINSPEGDFRIKFEAYAGMINIVCALMVTVSIPALFDFDSLNMDPAKDTYVLAFYCLLGASCAFVLGVILTSSYQMSGMTFTGSDLDTLALVTRHYPGPLSTGMIVGLVGLIGAMSCFVIDRYSEDLTAYPVTMVAMLAVMGSLLPRNASWGWMHGFKILMDPPSIFWDNAKDPSSKDFKIGLAYHGKKDARQAKLFGDDAAGASANQHSWMWDHETGEPVQTTEVWDSVLVSREGFLSKLLPWDNFVASNEDTLRYTNRIRCTMNEVRAYYDVPTAAAEPPIAVMCTGLLHITTYFTTKSYIDADGPYMNWLFTWKLKPEIRELLKHHIPDLDIDLFMTAPPSNDTFGFPNAGANWGSIGSAGDKMGFPSEGSWPESAVTKALGKADQAVIAVLQPFSEGDFRGLSFGDRLAALGELQELSPVVRIKLARHI